MEHYLRVIIGFRDEPIGSPTNKKSLFYIQYLLKKETKYYQFIKLF